MAGLRPTDRTIAKVARSNGGLYVADVHHAADPHASVDYVQTHFQWLEALRQANIAWRFTDGYWEVSTDFEDRAAELTKRNAADSGSVTTLSFLSLEA